MPNIGSAINGAEQLANTAVLRGIEKREATARLDRLVAAKKTAKLKS